MNGTNDTQDDGLKWSGEGFDGFPKRLPDDCVEYVLYVIDKEVNDILATRTRLNQILKTSKDSQRQLLHGYIWQRDPFELKLRPDVSSQDAARPGKPSSATPHLQGRTDFGDSVADEWLVVYLLLELSKQHPDAWIRVYDTDGEFLLIEAANSLPKWLNPDVAENRVWINNGRLRLIPLEGDVSSRNMSTQWALDFIRRNPEKLIISPFIQDEAFFRLRDYPSAISSSLHNALVSIPRRLAYLLHQDAAYISPAIEAFYLRDPVSLKPLATKDLSTLRFPPEDFVVVSVKFTKVGYAQLRSQIFDIPPAWTGITPRQDDPKVQMGMKLTCGFEMLLADSQHQDKQSVREMRLFLDDVENGEDVLPTDKAISGWPQTHDDEEWLDIDYTDLEDELSGKRESKRASGDRPKGAGFGDQHAQENLRKMVSRFEDFLKDDDAGAEGVDDDDDGLDESDSAEDEPEEETEQASHTEADFEKSMKETMGMPSADVEKSGLLEEARRLAIADAEEGSDMDEDEEMKKVMELMEQELKGHGALKLNDGQMERGLTKGKGKSKVTIAEKSKPGKPVYFGPERPPGMRSAYVKDEEESDEDVRPLGPGDEDLQPGEEELSSDDEEFNDIDLGLAKNMLEAFKGQTGMAGPAGNLMKALGVNMPRDEAAS